MSEVHILCTWLLIILVIHQLNNGNMVGRTYIFQIKKKDKVQFQWRLHCYLSFLMKNSMWRKELCNKLNMRKSNNPKLLKNKILIVDQVFRTIRERYFKFKEFNNCDSDIQESEWLVVNKTPKKPWTGKEVENTSQWRTNFQN